MVTATQGDKQIVTTTDQNGVYRFADLAEGTWTIKIDMRGFAPLAREVSVVAAPDNRLGERVAAVVLPRPGEAPPTLDDIRSHLGEVGLARQKWPESVHVVDVLPRTASGKVQKFVLRRRLRDGDLG